MRIGFVGCGAIGSCYASYLVNKHEVCVLDTYAPVIEAVKANGIYVEKCLSGVADQKPVIAHPAIATTDPKYVPLLIVLFAITYIPGLVTWLPNAIG